MKLKEIETMIASIIISNGLIDSAIISDYEIDLMDEYGMSSLAVVDLIIMLENIYNITFNDTDYDLDNFRNVRKIASLVLSKIDL